MERTKKHCCMYQYIIWFFFRLDVNSKILGGRIKKTSNWAKRPSRDVFEISISVSNKCFFSFIRCIYYCENCLGTEKVVTGSSANPTRQYELFLVLWQIKNLAIIKIYINFHLLSTLMYLRLHVRVDKNMPIYLFAHHVIKGAARLSVQHWVIIASSIVHFADTNIWVMSSGRALHSELLLIIETNGTPMMGIGGVPSLSGRVWAAFMMSPRW